MSSIKKAAIAATIAALATFLAPTRFSFSQEAKKNAYAKWKNGPPADPAYFPIAVWLQDPKYAPQYRKAGFNLYVGLWKGPTEPQLEALKSARMHVICAQNDLALKHIDDPIIVGWMHGDEPDNAQSLGKNKGYGPPIPPRQVMASYTGIRDADPSRPVLLNLGQGVAWDSWRGRGVRTNHPEDYPHYIRACDIVSFDIYPVVHSRPEVAGKLWFVARGVDRLRQWSHRKKIVWNCIECTRIKSNKKATPHQVRAEVWMSLIHGSMGLIYFVHEWTPHFNSHALLDDPQMLKAVTAINRRIRELAPVLNTPTVERAATVKPSPEHVPIDLMVKRYNGKTYLFAVCMRNAPARALFQVQGLPESATAQVLGEVRKIPVRNGRFTDNFNPYDVHLYSIR